jgi:hypothetical protein
VHGSPFFLYIFVFIIACSKKEGRGVGAYFPAGLVKGWKFLYDKNIPIILVLPSFSIVIIGEIAGWGRELPPFFAFLRKGIGVTMRKRMERL